MIIYTAKYLQIQINYVKLKWFRENVSKSLAVYHLVHESI